MEVEPVAHRVVPAAAAAAWPSQSILSMRRHRLNQKRQGNFGWLNIPPCLRTTTQPTNEALVDSGGRGCRDRHKTQQAKQECGQKSGIGVPTERGWPTWTTAAAAAASVNSSLLESAEDEANEGT